jgi:hypothetical protein
MPVSFLFSLGRGAEISAPRPVKCQVPGTGFGTIPADYSIVRHKFLGGKDLHYRAVFRPSPVCMFRVHLWPGPGRAQKIRTPCGTDVAVPLGILGCTEAISSGATNVRGNSEPSRTVQDQLFTSQAPPPCPAPRRRLEKTWMKKPPFLIPTFAPPGGARMAKGRVGGFSSSAGLSTVGLLPEQVDVNILQG